MSQLDFSDINYFKDCLNDQLDLWVPIIIKRCIAITRTSEYPDDPPSVSYQLIHCAADVREVALSEVAHSGGFLLVGDNVLFTQQQLRGPSDGNGTKDDPMRVADTIVIHNSEWVITGSPLQGYLKDGYGPTSYQAYIRRRRGGLMFNTEAGFDDQLIR